MKSIDVEDEYSFNRVTTRDEIQKTIFEAMVHVKKHYGDNCTIRDLLKEIEKIEKRSTTGLGVPFYCVYPIILGQALKKRKTLLEDIVQIYEYAYHCNFEFIGFDSTYKPRLDKLGDKRLTLEEIMDAKIDLELLLDPNFIKEYGAHLFSEQDFGRRHSVEEYLEMEKKAKEIEAKRQEEKKEKKEKKSGRR